MCTGILSVFGDTEGVKRTLRDQCRVTVQSFADGRLGNDMYRYLSGEGAAAHLKCNWCPPEPLVSRLRNAGLQMFHTNLPLCSSTQWTHVQEDYPTMSPDWQAWKHIRSLRLGGYLQAWEYHGQHRTSTLLYSKSVQQACDNAVRHVCPDGADVSMHVRGGDLMQAGVLPRRDFFLPHVRGCTVVVSDSPNWVRKNLAEGVHYLQYSPAIDMCIAGSGRKIVLTAGTFDLMAAYFRKHGSAKILMDQKASWWSHVNDLEAIDRLAPKKWLHTSL